MQVESLSHFLALTQHRSLAATAKQLGISPSTLSRQMKALEQELGVELFVARQRPLSLSYAGQCLLERVPKLLQTLYQMEQLVAGQRKHRLQIGWNGAWGIFYLPGLIKACAQGPWAQHQIESHSYSPQEALELFDLGLLDVWISTYANQFERSLDASNLRQRGLELYVGPASDCLIAARPRPDQQVSDWQSLKYISLSPYTFKQSLWDEQKYPRQIAVSLSSVSDALALAQHSDLALYLPTVYLQQALLDKRLALMAQAPFRQSLNPGIVLNPNSLADRKPALLEILAQAGFRLQMEPEA